MLTQVYKGAFTQSDGTITNSEFTLTILNRTFVGIDRTDHAVYELAGEVTPNGMLVGCYYNENGDLLGSITLIDKDSGAYEGYCTGLQEGGIFSLPLVLTP